MSKYGDHLITKRPRVSAETAIQSYRRVLKLVNGYLKAERQGLLATDGRGLMTWGEVRHHVQCALSMRVNELDAAKPARKEKR